MSEPDTGELRAREDVKLVPPPRPVPPGLPVYLLLLASQFGWLFLGVGGLLFWFNCAFGADVKAPLFLVSPPATSGTVTGFEVTPLIEGTGTSYIAGHARYATSTQAIFAIHYSYALPGGGTERGTSYEGASAEDGPALMAGQTGEPVAVGLKVPVQYVRALPSISRIQGMRSNVYPLYALGVLVFALVGVVLLRPALKNYRRIRFLLTSGVEDAGHQNLQDPAGRLPSLPLEGPFVRWLGIRGGQFHAPGAVMWMKVLFIPAGGLLASLSYLWHHWGAILYTWHSLIGP